MESLQSGCAAHFALRAWAHHLVGEPISETGEADDGGGLKRRRWLVGIIAVADVRGVIMVGARSK